MRGLLVALTFLTVLPLPFAFQPSDDDIRHSRWWYPVVGIFLGAALGGWAWFLLRCGVSPSLAALLVLALWALATGLLHLDGWCDCCDGLFGGHTAEERLRICRDPHVGTFGLVGGVLLLLGKFVLLQDAMTRWGDRVGLAVGTCAVVARCHALCVAAGAPYPRPDGTGKLLVTATRGWEALVFTGWAILLTAGAAVGCGVAPVVGFVCALGVAMGLRWLAMRRLGGITGDCLGAAIEGAELAFLLGIALAGPH